MVLSNQVVLTSLSVEELKQIIETTVKAALANNFLEEKTVTSNYLSRKEAAKLLGISLPSLHRYTLQGKLIAHRVGSSVRYKPNEIEAALVSMNVRRN